MVAGFILDLVGYTADHNLAGATIVKPSRGTCAFVRPVVGGS
jgi:hypothetical protein